MEQEGHMNKNIVIFIAEDSHTQAAHLRLTLEKYNYKVLVAYDGMEAFEKIKKNQP